MHILKGNGANSLHSPISTKSALSVDGQKQIVHTVVLHQYHGTVRLSAITTNQYVDLHDMTL